VPVWVVGGEGDALLDVCGFGDVGDGDVMARIDHGRAVGRVRSDVNFTGCGLPRESDGTSGGYQEE